MIIAWEHPVGKPLTPSLTLSLFHRSPSERRSGVGGLRASRGVGEVNRRETEREGKKEKEELAHSTHMLHITIITVVAHHLYSCPALHVCWVETELALLKRPNHIPLGKWSAICEVKLHWQVSHPAAGGQLSNEGQ